MDTVNLLKLSQKMKLENCTSKIDISNLEISHADVNRPALQLAGFFKHFDSERIQVIGNVENEYMENLDLDERKKAFEELLKYKVPCIVFCNNANVSEELIELGTKYDVPIFRTSTDTSPFIAELIKWLHVQLAPTMCVHGVFVDVYGEGVLIMGESGVGKSETALELIKRGHRLVADDRVNIIKVSDETLVGQAPAIIKNFIELRGVGVLDVKTLYGVESIKDSQHIDLVIQVKDWKKDAEFESTDYSEKYIEFLGNKVSLYKIAIRPGRNLAIICESAAVNHRQIQMGYKNRKSLNKKKEIL